MYICEYDHVFDDPETERDKIGECFGSPAYQDFEYCPVCGSENFGEADICDNCGRYFDVCDLTHGLCKVCSEEQEIYGEF